MPEARDQVEVPVVAVVAARRAPVQPEVDRLGAEVLGRRAVRRLAAPARPPPAPGGGPVGRVVAPARSAGSPVSGGTSGAPGHQPVAPRRRSVRRRPRPRVGADRAAGGLGEGPLARDQPRRRRTGGPRAGRGCAASEAPAAAPWLRNRKGQSPRGSRARPRRGGRPRRPPASSASSSVRSPKRTTWRGLLTITSCTPSLRRHGRELVGDHAHAATPARRRAAARADAPRLGRRLGLVARAEGAARRPPPARPTSCGRAARAGASSTGSPGGGPARTGLRTPSGGAAWPAFLAGAFAALPLPALAPALHAAQAALLDRRAGRRRPRPRRLALGRGASAAASGAVAVAVAARGRQAGLQRGHQVDDRRRLAASSGSAISSPAAFASRNSSSDGAGLVGVLLRLERPRQPLDELLAPSPAPPPRPRRPPGARRSRAGRGCARPRGSRASRARASRRPGAAAPGAPWWRARSARGPRGPSPPSRGSAARRAARRAPGARASRRARSRPGRPRRSSTNCRIWIVFSWRAANRSSSASSTGR